MIKWLAEYIEVGGMPRWWSILLHTGLIYMVITLNYIVFWE